jgi:hypothetical protein
MVFPPCRSDTSIVAERYSGSAGPVVTHGGAEGPLVIGTDACCIGRWRTRGRMLSRNARGQRWETNDLDALEQESAALLAESVAGHAETFPMASSIRNSSAATLPTYWSTPDDPLN